MYNQDRPSSYNHHLHNNSNSNTNNSSSPASNPRYTSNPSSSSAYRPTSVYSNNNTTTTSRPYNSHSHYRSHHHHPIHSYHIYHHPSSNPRYHHHHHHHHQPPRHPTHHHTQQPSQQQNTPRPHLDVILPLRSCTQGPTPTYSFHSPASPTPNPNTQAIPHNHPTATPTTSITPQPTTPHSQTQHPSTHPRQNSQSTPAATTTPQSLPPPPPSASTTPNPCIPFRSLPPEPNSCDELLSVARELRCQPMYDVSRIGGKDHFPLFRAAVYLADVPDLRAQGVGRSKMAARRAAASAYLLNFDQSDPDITKAISDLARVDRRNKEPLSKDNEDGKEMNDHRTCSRNKGNETGDDTLKEQEGAPVTANRDESKDSKFNEECDQEKSTLMTQVSPERATTALDSNPSSEGTSAPRSRLEKGVSDVQVDMTATPNVSTSPNAKSQAHRVPPGHSSALVYEHRAPHPAHTSEDGSDALVPLIHEGKADANIQLSTTPVAVKENSNSAEMSQDYQPLPALQTASKQLSPMKLQHPSSVIDFQPRTITPYIDENQVRKRPSDSIVTPTSNAPPLAPTGAGVATTCNSDALEHPLPTMAGTREGPARYGSSTQASVVQLVSKSPRLYESADVSTQPLEGTLEKYKQGQGKENGEEEEDDKDHGNSFDNGVAPVEDEPPPLQPLGISRVIESVKPISRDTTIAGRVVMASPLGNQTRGNGTAALVGRYGGTLMRAEQVSDTPVRQIDFNNDDLHLNPLQSTNEQLHTNCIRSVVKRTSSGRIVGNNGHIGTGTERNPDTSHFNGSEGGNIYGDGNRSQKRVKVTPKETSQHSGVPLRLRIYADMHDDKSMETITLLGTSSLNVVLDVQLFTTDNKAPAYHIFCENVVAEVHLIRVTDGLNGTNGDKNGGTSDRCITTSCGAIYASIAYAVGAQAQEMWIQRAKHVAQGYNMALSPRILVLHRHEMFAVLRERNFIDVLQPSDNLTTYARRLLRYAENEFTGRQGVTVHMDRERVPERSFEEENNANTVMAQGETVGHATLTEKVHVRYGGSRYGGEYASTGTTGDGGVPCAPSVPTVGIGASRENDSGREKRNRSTIRGVRTEWDKEEF